MGDETFPDSDWENPAALAVVSPRAAAMEADVRALSTPLEFTPMQRAMIRDTCAPGATEKEFQVLMEIAKLRRLNPLLKQIHFVKRWNRALGRDVWSAQVSIDGLRAIAERTGKYDGQDEAEFTEGANGIISCRVRVYRKDWSRPAVGVAYWSEYVQTARDGNPTAFWRDMGHVMIAKCAEAIAMRKAFPEDLGGLYTDEEMQQSENHAPAPPQIAPHIEPGAPLGDPGLMGELLGKFENIKVDCAACDSYDKALALRALLGTRTQQSELTRRAQQGRESGDINPSVAAELGRLWMHCNRQVERLERDLAPKVEESFGD